jgi:hypothetical protein
MAWYHTFRDDLEDWIAVGIIASGMAFLAIYGVFI